MKINYVTRAISGVVLLLTCIGASAQSQNAPVASNNSENQAADDQTQDGQQSLGDVARASKQKKAAGAVIDNEAVAANRAKRSGNDNGALNCDSDCVAAVKRAVQQQPGLRMSEDKWRTSLSAGEDLLYEDGEWGSLFAEIQQRVCHPKSAAGNANAADDLDRRVAKKLMDEVREGLNEISHSMADAKNQTLQAQVVADARALAIKQLIVKVQVERAKSNCLTAVSAKSTN